MRRYNVSIQLGKNIQKIRRQKKISQEELAARVGVHRNHMGRIERGESTPPLYRIEKIAKALGIDIKNLLSF